MRKSLICIISLLFVLHSCSSDDNMSDPPEETITYTGTVKSIMEGKCIGCHAEQPINGAPMSLITLEEVKESIQNRNLILRIEDGTMPPGNSTLSNEEIQAIKDWANNNFPE